MPRLTETVPDRPGPALKAVVLARGLGTRMRQAADVALDPDQAAMAARGAKAMMPIGGRPLLDYILSSLADAGATEVCLVIGPEHDFIRRHYTELAVPRRLLVRYAVQTEPRGTADAVLAAEPFAGSDRFLVVNSDNLYPVEAIRRLGMLDGSGLVGYDRETLIKESNIDPDRIAKFALIWADAAGRLTRIVEKPDPAVMAQSNLVSMNSWRFTSRIFDACRAVRPSPRGELELQDAVTHAIDVLGEPFQVIPWSSGVLDLSSRADVALVEARLRGVEVRP